MSRKLLLAFDEVLRDLYPWNHLCVHNVERFAVGTVFVCPENTGDLKFRSQHAAVGEFVHIPSFNPHPFKIYVCRVDAARVECCRRRIRGNALERFGSDGREEVLGRPSVDRLTSRVIVGSLKIFVMTRRPKSEVPSSSLYFTQGSSFIENSTGSAFVKSTWACAMNLP